jgi:hypothetical protein
MWVWMDFVDYIKKIHTLIKSNWILLLESQNLEVDPFDKNLSKIRKLFKIIEINNSNDHLNRKIAILKKINNDT